MTQTKPHIIQVNNLIKRYSKSQVNAVDDVSFYVEEGSFFSLLGPNGAGKTTILSILNTTLSMTSGEVIVAGHDLNKKPDKVRQNIGVIFQNSSLDDNLTAEENIRFHANLYQLYPYRPSFSLMPKSYQKKVKHLASVLGLENEMKKPVKALSGGMKRKLEIIRSLMHNPKVLFLDEPTTGLDPLSRNNLWEYLKDVRKQHQTTIFLTTHYLNEAEDSDYLAIINSGHLIAKGTPTEIKHTLIDQHLILDANDREKLKKELKSKHIKFTGTGPFNLSINSHSAQTLIKKINTPLSYLDINNPTLEQAYIEIINQQTS